MKHAKHMKHIKHMIRKRGSIPPPFSKNPAAHAPAYISRYAYRMREAEPAALNGRPGSFIFRRINRINYFGKDIFLKKTAPPRGKVGGAYILIQTYTDLYGK